MADVTKDANNAIESRYKQAKLLPPPAFSILRITQKVLVLENFFPSTPSSNLRVYSLLWQTTVYGGVSTAPISSSCLPMRLDQGIITSKFLIKSIVWLFYYYFPLS